MNGTTTSTSNYICHCGCGQVVAVEFTGGFAGTTCKIEACDKARKIGMMDFTVRRSAVLSMEPASSQKMVAHKTGRSAIAASPRRFEADFASVFPDLSPTIVEVRPLTAEESEWVLIWNPEAETEGRVAYVVDTGDVVTFAPIDDPDAAIRFEVTIFRADGSITEGGSIYRPILDDTEEVA